ncbi:hypothetical protein TRICI_006592 [Trichomonascus ciferrii]|uniref:Uncharacterized protein n=1 Tax=Trichomonascus ciferrii TaxID=44093 RepID=A0A642UG22_9ASCO|nr:hypothetical protein TRICI_006592 [Trichomonascus ciferrii]
MANKKKKSGGVAANNSGGGQQQQQQETSPQEQLRNEYREKKMEEAGGSPSRRPSPGFLFSASQLADGKMPSSKEDGTGEEKEVTLPPMRGAKTSSITDRHPQLMSKEVYMAKQNSVFKDLSGYSSWKQLSEEQKNKDREDTYLTKITEYVIAGLDESIYNEFLEQRYIMDEVEYAGQEALSIVADDEQTHCRLQRLITDFATLKAQVSRLELEFVKMRKARIAAETEVTDIRSYYQKEMIKRIKLEELCRCLNRKVVSYEKKAKDRSQQRAISSVDGDGSSHSAEAIDQWESTISRLISSLSDPSSDKRSVKDKTRELKNALKLFFKQYKACEDYYRHRVSMKNLEIQVYLARLEKYKQTYEREAKRAQLLSEQVEISAKTENELRTRVMQCEEKLAESSDLIDQSQGMFDKVKNHMLAMKENQSLRDEVAELKKQLVQERKEKEFYKSRANTPAASTPKAAPSSNHNNGTSPKKGQSQPNGDKKMNGGVSRAEESNRKYANEYPRAARTDDMSRIYRPGDRIIRKGFKGTVVDPVHPVNIKPGSTVVELGDEVGDIVPATYETFSNDAHKAWFKDSLLSAQEYHEAKRDSQRQHRHSEDDDEEDEEGYSESEEYDEGSEYDSTEERGQLHCPLFLPEFDPRVANQFLEGSIDRLGRAEQEDDDKTGMSTVDYFKEFFGFDITGKSFSEILNTYSKRSAGACKESNCPIHSQDSKVTKTWNDLMLEFQNHSDQGPKSSNGSRLIRNRPVFGPERPPDMLK